MKISSKLNKLQIFGLLIFLEAAIYYLLLWICGPNPIRWVLLSGINILCYFLGRRYVERIIAAEFPPSQYIQAIVNRIYPRIPKWREKRLIKALTRIYNISTVDAYIIYDNALRNAHNQRIYPSSAMQQIQKRYKKDKRNK